jgi:hypothetical protein
VAQVFLKVRVLDINKKKGTLPRHMKLRSNENSKSGEAINYEAYSVFQYY